MYIVYVLIILNSCILYRFELLIKKLYKILCILGFLKRDSNVF